MIGKYILDSSIWIEIERENPSVLALVEPYILANDVCVVDVIVAELLRGTKSRKDFLRLEKVFADFPQLQTSWSRVSELAFLVARKGWMPPLIDLYIAQCAIEAGKVIVTQDKHFSHIAKIESFEIVLVPA